MSRTSFILFCCLSSWVGYATLRTEYLNARAGYPLPMDAAKAEDKRNDGSGAWRAFRMDEATGKQLMLAQSGEIEDRPLTAEESAAMRKQIVASNANADLQDFVGIAGCVQYPAILLALLLGLGWLCDPKASTVMRTFSAGLILLNVSALAVTIYRGPLRALID